MTLIFEHRSMLLAIIGTYNRFNLRCSRSAMEMYCFRLSLAVIDGAKGAST